MKKIILLLVPLICIIVVGCTTSSTKKAETLKDAYFTIAKKIEKSDNITENYIKSLLKGYKYEKEDVVKDYINDSDAQPHRFTNNNETLTIFNYTIKNKSYFDITYMLKNDLNSVQIAYSKANSPTHSKDGLYTYVSVSDLKLYEKLSSILDIDKSKLLDNYNTISKDILEKKDININELKKLIGMEPIFKELNKSSQEILYSFGNDIEGIGAYYIKDENKISRVTYGLRQGGFMKSTIGINSTENREHPSTSITTYVDSIEKQEKSLNLIFE